VWRDGTKVVRHQGETLMRKVGMAVVLLATGLVLPALSSSSAQADGAGVGSP